MIGSRRGYLSAVRVKNTKDQSLHETRSMFQILNRSIMVLQCMLVILLTLNHVMSFPNGSPGCDYSPDSVYAHAVPPQNQTLNPHNIKLSKTEFPGWVAIRMEDPEGSLKGFLVKTYHSGQFYATKGVKECKCDGKNCCYFFPFFLICFLR